MNWYEDCVYGKQTRRPFASGRSWRGKQRLHLVLADIWEPMQTKSHSGSRYFLLFVDDYTRMSWVYILKYKHEVLSCFQKFLAFVETQIGQKLKIIRTKRGGEFVSWEFDLFCSHHGIKYELSASIPLSKMELLRGRTQLLLKEPC